jgi:hypothetical protein
MKNCEFFFGFDSRESAAYEVCVRSLLRHASCEPRVHPILQAHARGLGLYTRHQERRDGRLWDTISEAPMATEFAITRFLTPILAQSEWAVFGDSDFLWRADAAELLALADPRYAVMVVKHDYAPTESVKMDGQLQLLYARKNWSSLILWNCRHPAHAALGQFVNEWAGRRLHAFEWLEDGLIGELPPEWNWLEGHSDPSLNPKAVHFTRGTPDMPGYESVPYSREWREVLESRDGVAPDSGGLPPSRTV